MLALSSSRFRIKDLSPEELIGELSDYGFKGIELEYRITEDYLQELSPLLKKEGIDVVSVHNYFPVPEMIEKPGADVFLFTSDDELEREMALKYSIKTIRRASDLQAEVVILHLGKIPVGLDVKKVYQDINEGKPVDLKNAIGERERNKKRFYDRSLSMIDRLVDEAAKRDVILGLENRYHFNEIPSIDEVGDILKRFRGAPVGYWHDAGHAYVMEFIGLHRQELYLERYSEDLLGVHIHDARGIKDHLSPGEGEIDFAGLFEYLRKDSRLVIETHPKSDNRLFLNGLNIIKKLYHDLFG